MPKNPGFQEAKTGVLWQFERARCKIDFSEKMPNIYGAGIGEHPIPAPSF